MVEHQSHPFWWHYLSHNKLVQIYCSLGIRTFALSLVALFIPLYLHFELGYSMQQTLLFYLVYAVIFAIASPIAAKVAARFGSKHAIMYSIPLYLIYILLLYLLPSYPTPLFVLSVLSGFSLAFYWMGMHQLFFYASDKKHRGEEVGKRTAASVAGALIAPALGGLIIAYFGFYEDFKAEDDDGTPYRACTNLMTCWATMFDATFKFDGGFTGLFAMDPIGYVKPKEEGGP